HRPVACGWAALYQSKSRFGNVKTIRCASAEFTVLSGSQYSGWYEHSTWNDSSCTSQVLPSHSPSLEKTSPPKRASSESCRAVRISLPTWASSQYRFSLDQPWLPRVNYSLT